MPKICPDSPFPGFKNLRLVTKPSVLDRHDGIYHPSMLGHRYRLRMSWKLAFHEFCSSTRVHCYDELSVVDYL